MDDVDMVPAASPTRPDIEPDLPREAPPPRVIAAEWALWGKEAHETGYHVLRCSRGALREKNFSEAITRYSPGGIEGLPHYTVSWIPGANREPEYIAIGIHELAPADPRQAGGRSRVDAVGREIVFVRLFCLRYADLAEQAVSHGQALGYRDLIQAVAGIHAPAGATERAPVTLPAEPLPIFKQGPLRKQAEQVAVVLLTDRQVCILDADDVPVADRLQFIDTVMAMLPYGQRAAMSAATWASSTSQELKLRLFFASGPRAGSRLAGGGRARAEDFLAHWDRPDEVEITDPAPRLYQRWLRDVKSRAPALLAGHVEPVRFAAADVRRMVGSLPGDKSVPATLDDLDRNLRKAEPDQDAIVASIKRLRRYLAGTDQPAVSLEVQREYRRSVCDYRLLADHGRLSPQRKGQLYDLLLRLAFGPALTYDGYCDIEQSAGYPLPRSLETALRKFAAAGWATFILARLPQPGFRGADVLADGIAAPAGEPLDALMTGVERRTLKPRHARLVLDWALRDLRVSSINPGAPLAERGYLVPACAYVYHDDPDEQVRQLRRVLSIAFDSRLGRPGRPVRLGRPEIDTIFFYLTGPPTPALREAITSMTTTRNHDYVSKKVFEAFPPRQEVPDWAVYFRQVPRWRRWLPWLRARPDRGPAAPFQGSPWEHPKALISFVIVVVALMVAGYITLQAMFPHP